MKASLISHPIRSFVLRNGKMTRAQARAYRDLKDRYCIPFDPAQPLDFSRLFSGFAQVVLEIGFGMGEATAKLAEARKETGFLGIEVHTAGVGKLLWEIEQRKLENIRIIEEDAVLVLNCMIPPKSLDGVHIFFPDPWPKKRHHKRRLLTPDFLNLVASRMKDRAYLYLVTDWEEYAHWMVNAAKECPSLENPSQGFSLRQSWRPETAFERKGIQAGRSIYEIYLRAKHT